MLGKKPIKVGSMTTKLTGVNTLCASLNDFAYIVAGIIIPAKKIVNGKRRTNKLSINVGVSIPSITVIIAGLSTKLKTRSPKNKPSKERSEEHTSELQSRPHLVCRLLL